jgi:O-antigen ligase
VVAPDFAVHQITDVLEPSLAGDWRGVFGHKNTAGAIFALCVFFGIYIAREDLVVPGIAIAAASALFVLMSGAKSATVFLVFVLALSGVAALVRSAALRALIVGLPLVILLALGPGTVLNKNLASVTSALPFDMTFTGRVDVWELAFSKIAEKPLTGYGFSAFWTLESTKFGSEDIEAWAGGAAHAHNGYIDTALNVGLPGLVLALVVFLWLPLRNFNAAHDRDCVPALAMMLFQVWLFGVYLSTMETFLFDRDNPIWFTFLFAVFGLRFVAALRDVAD